jgi:hypothetical protein
MSLPASLYSIFCPTSILDSWVPFPELDKAAPCRSPSLMCVCVSASPTILSSHFSLCSQLVSFPSSMRFLEGWKTWGKLENHSTTPAAKGPTDTTDTADRLHSGTMQPAIQVLILRRHGHAHPALCGRGCPRKRPMLEQDTPRFQPSRAPESWLFRLCASRPVPVCVSAPAAISFLFILFVSSFVIRFLGWPACHLLPSAPPICFWGLHWTPFPPAFPQIRPRLNSGEFSKANYYHYPPSRPQTKTRLKTGIRGRVHEGKGKRQA